MAPKQTDPQFKLRMTPEVKAAIEEAAERNNRSMNAEILHRLEDSLEIDNLAGVGPSAGLLLRLPEELTDRISSAAKRMNRTTAAQALDTLEKSYLPITTSRSDKSNL